MIKILKTPWKNQFLELVGQAKRSIRITSPFVKNDISNEMILAKKNNTKVELLTSFKLMSVYSGSIDITALENIINNNGEVKNVSNLHSKMYLFDDSKAIITSGNLTYGGMVKNYEYGVYLDEKTIIRSISNDFDALSNDSKTGIIKSSNIETVKNIISKIQKAASVKLPPINFETNLKQIYPANEHIPDKVRQQLQYLRDLGLIEFLGSGTYKKLWK